MKHIRILIGMDGKNNSNMVKETKTDDVTNIEISKLNYVSVVPMTFEERYHMYMRCKKEELAKMLAQRDELDALRQPVVQPYPVPVSPSYPPEPIPTYPGPFTPWITYCNAQNTDIS